MNLTVKDLLDAGVHFGHQVRRFNPKSKKFVFDHRHGVSIIDLELTYRYLEDAGNYLENLVAEGGVVLFVGTKRQAQEIIREAATACQMPFCANRWLGGTLTNYATIKSSVDKYKRYLSMEEDGSLDKLHNKESSAIRREMSRMNRNFEGILEMETLPDALFVVDVKTEAIAVSEAVRLNIPVVALVDTNSDPTGVGYPIPGNDDSTKSVRIIVEAVMEAVLNGNVRKSDVDSAPVVPQPLAQRADIVEETLPSIAPARRGGSEDEDVPESFST